MKLCRACKKEIDDKATKCPYCQTKQGSWAQRHPILTVLGILFVLGMIGNAVSPKSPTTSPTSTPEPKEADATTVPSTATSVPEATKVPVTAEPDTKPGETVSQQNALRQAKSYLDFTAFSKKGLIKQLVYEKYSTEDATYAAENVNADWNVQAEKKAKSYQEMTPMSRAGLIKQLEYEGFTTAEANHGADSVGL